MYRNNYNYNIRSLFRCRDVNSDTTSDVLIDNTDDNCLIDKIDNDPDGGAVELPAHLSMDQKNDFNDNNSVIVEVEEEVEEIINYSDESDVCSDGGVNCIDGYSTGEQDYLTDEFLLDRIEGLLVAQWNCQGFTINAIAHIHYIIENKRPDIFMLQEAYVHYAEKFRNWIDNIKGYVTWTLKSGFGKVIILVRDGIYAERINIRFQHNISMDKLLRELDINNENYSALRNDILMSKLYVLTLKINSIDMGQSVIINNWYRPQNGSRSSVKLLISYLEQLNRTKDYGNYPLYGGGDGNIHNELWFNGEVKK
eukprot:325493_1